jgi:hypothetical protein
LRDTSYRETPTSDSPATENTEVESTLDREIYEAFQGINRELIDLSRQYDEQGFDILEIERLHDLYKEFERSFSLFVDTKGHERIDIGRKILEQISEIKLAIKKVWDIIR